MPSPVYVMRLFNNHFNSNAVCLGPQMQQLLEAVKDDLADCVWFVADIDAFQVLPMGVEWHNQIPVLVGGTEAMIAFAGQVRQFLWGIFLAVPETALPIQWANDFDTESPTFTDVDEVVLEIRTFDTSFFELYSRDLAAMKRVSERFSVAIEQV